MKRLLVTAAALSLTATSAFANTNYPVVVERDGVTYNCEAGIVTKGGEYARKCVVADKGGLFAGGLGGGSILFLALGGAAVAAVLSDRNNNSTNGTN
ncbi:hypothetical protein OS190_09720 [Sulfitobacter sp. F26204]|uniref:hypothetical protein n=1 Tax=Sulfitobacter sp. F26204 TaxID=2996014 RepID=UPI00225DF586|nr:hypothetical protein [Sulfitobacter sp. F26204]MCX7559844.1 hypothetical protein [Sulfitobacter sp. F26204]